FLFHVFEWKTCIWYAFFLTKLSSYEFSKSPTVVNIEEILESINKDDILTSLTQEDSLEE
ncbi:hypothetical protein, partial [Bacillus cereus]|uniref:hypothetical protein n=1 Tax=Bacillus cereus TaxID=1396 RepID=UPI00383DEBC5|nr:hypothetical protein [Bacillus cereus]